MSFDSNPRPTPFETRTRSITARGLSGESSVAGPGRAADHRAEVAGPSHSVDHEVPPGGAPTERAANGSPRPVHPIDPAPQEHQEDAEAEHRQHGWQQVKRQQQMNPAAKPIAAVVRPGTGLIPETMPRGKTQAIHHRDSWVVQTRAMGTDPATRRKPQARPGRGSWDGSAQRLRSRSRSQFGSRPPTPRPRALRRATL